MIPKHKILLTTTACLLIQSAAILNAQPLLFDFGPTSVAAPYLTMDPGHNAGTISAADTSWNVITTSAVNSSLHYGDGSAATGLSLSLGQEASAGNNTISYTTPITSLTLAGSGGAVPGQTNLLGAGSIYGNDTSSTAVGRDGFFGSGTAGTGNAIGLQISGLTAGNYLLYIMARNVNSDAAAYAMNVYNFTGPAANTFNFSALTPNIETNTGYAAASYVGQYNTFVNGQNYIGLSVTINSGDSLYVAVDGIAPTDTRGFLNALEIVPEAMPEPGMGALMALGGLAALALVKRRN